MIGVLGMTDWTDPRRAHRVVVTDRAPAGFGRVHYVDAFAATVAPGDPRTAEELLRAALESMPAVVRGIVLSAWRGLGFELGPLGSPSHILGMSIDHNTPEIVELSASGERAAARIVGRRVGDEITATSFVAAHRLSARIVWVGVAPAHRRVVRYLMNRAVSARPA